MAGVLCVYVEGGSEGGPADLSMLLNLKLYPPQQYSFAFLLY